MGKVKVKFKRLHQLATMPAKQRPDDVGYDIYAFGTYQLAPGERKTVGTKASLEIPEGYEGQIRPRSGLASKKGITVLNSPGTIEPSYRGELKVILLNTSDEHFIVETGMRIAQLVIAKTLETEEEEVKELSETERGEAGFGSSGLH